MSQEEKKKENDNNIHDTICTFLDNFAFENIEKIKDENNYILLDGYKDADIVKHTGDDDFPIEYFNPLYIYHMKFDENNISAFDSLVDYDLNADVEKKLKKKRNYKRFFIRYAF